MHLMYYLDERGNRVYTLKVSEPMPDILSTIRADIDFVINQQKEDKNDTPTNSAHPARFSPDDKFSRERIICKKRFGLLPTQVGHHVCCVAKTSLLTTS